MQYLKKIFFIFLFLFFLVFGTLLVIAFAYEKEVKDYMIEELNKNLKTKVIVEGRNIGFSLFKNFPYASLAFKNVTMLESPIGNSASDRNGKGNFLTQDTLFSIEDISLQFSVLDIFKEQYVVKKISADNGFVKLRIGMDGSQNWRVWKGSVDTTSADEESAFNLEKFILKNVSVRYFNFKNRNNVSCSIKKSQIGGEFTSNEYELSIESDLFVDHFNVDSINYVENKPVKMDLRLKVDNDNGLYIFNDALLHLADLKITVEGKYISTKTSDYIDVFLKGKDMSIQSVLSLLPEKYSRHVNDYDSEGEFYCNAHINGKIDDLNSPEVKTDFGITKADITQLSSGISLRGVHVIGSYFSSSVSSKYFLDLKTFSASLANGNISGSVKVDNFSSPNIKASLNANLLLEDVRHLLKIDTIWTYSVKSLAGNVRINMQYKGRINNSGIYTKADFENMNLSGEMTLENAGMKIKNSALEFDSINGSFVLNNNSVTVSSFSGRTPKSDFYLKGILKDILAYSFAADADMNVEATFQSNNFDLNEFLINQTKSSKRDTVYNVRFSPRVNFILNSDIGHLAFRKFEANNIHGTFKLNNQRLIGDPISFRTMDGSVTAIGMIDGTQEGILLVTCNSNLKNLNISKLFSQFENFSQNAITHNHLKGIVTAEVRFASVWKSDLSVDMDRIYVHSNLTIEKGELIKFEPLKALSKYISLSELETIKFSALQNQIEIKNRKVVIPKMNIQSSALDLALSGTHSFNNEIDYHFKVLMSDILFQKARRAKKENSEFGIVENDKSGKTSLFISMTGTMDSPILKYDKQGARQDFKENIAKEKQTLKQILGEEFKWFKKDTMRSKKEKRKEDDKFIIKWEEEEEGKSKQENDDF